MTDVLSGRWRTGRIPCTIFAQEGKYPADGDQLIGVMFTAELAEEAVAAHNVRARVRGTISDQSNQVDL